MSSIWTPGGERPVRPQPEAEPSDRASSDRAPSDQAMGAGELSEEERAALDQELAAMQEEVANTPAAVVVANHAVGLFQLAAIHLNRRPPNLGEGRVAIDAMGALVEGMAGRLGEEEQSLRDGLGQLRMAYVQLSNSAGSPEQPPG